MKIVVSDTGPVHYLIWIGQIALLPALYGEVILPTHVLHELQHPRAPQAIRDGAASPPEWIQIRQPRHWVALQKPLDQGEHEALSLAVEMKAALLLMDERDGRQAASHLGLQFVGTLGILLAAAKQGILSKEDAITALHDLSKTNKRIRPSLIQAALAALNVDEG